jgi:adenine deaminase
MRTDRLSKKSKITGRINLIQIVNYKRILSAILAPMQQFDLVLKNVLVNGAFNADIGIKNGLITALGLGLVSTDDTQVIDCKSAIVTPGGIDGHVHLAQDQSPRAKQAGYRCADNSKY